MTSPADRVTARRCAIRDCPNPALHGRAHCRRHHLTDTLRRVIHLKG